jgi:hypothetical protein
MFQISYSFSVFILSFKYLIAIVNGDVLTILSLEGYKIVHSVIRYLV